jgi:uncharacterized protein YndB with AHSA1/START domain
MTVTNVEKDLTALTLTVTADFDADVKRVWQLWADPRKLEQWWGPPGYPATFTTHDLTPGARTLYYMTSPEGERYHGLWDVVAVDEPSRIEVEDSFADEHGNPSADMPTGRMEVSLEDRGGGTRMIIMSRHASREDLEQVLAMGMEEGIRASVGQMDALLA